MIYQDDLTVQRIRTAHPKLRKKMLQDYLDYNNRVLGKWQRGRASDVYRQSYEQAEKYASGRTAPGSIITHAKAGQSYHEYGLAKDMVILYDYDKNGTFEKASWDLRVDFDNDGIREWAAMIAFYSSRGWTNGYIRNGKKLDYPHMQYTFGYHWSELQEMVKNNNVIKEIIGGVEYIYPNI